MKWLIGLVIIGGLSMTVLPRSIRNNNPGNIRKNIKFKWRGEVGQDDKGFVKFDSPENGFRAMSIILKKYYRDNTNPPGTPVNGYGLKTIREIIYRYAPPSDKNPSEKYAQTIAKRLMVPVGSPLADKKFYEILPELIYYISEFESGKRGHYKIAQAKAGVNMA